MESIYKCLVCGSEQFSEYLTCRDFTVSNEYFAINQCDSCGFRFTSPRPTEAEIGPYYQAKDYISHTNKSKGLITLLYHKVREYAVSQKVKLIRKHVSQQAAVMDVGAGTGYFVKQLITSSFKATGYEPSDEARQVAKHDFGVDLLPLKALFEATDQSVQCITLWHVLEHIHALNSSLEQFKKLLSDGGYLIIAVPNSDSFDAHYYRHFWAAYDVPRHLYHFTPATVEKLMNRLGFKLIENKPMLFDSAYVSILSEKYKSGKLSVLQIVKGIVIGLYSNIHAFFSSKNYSSHIYIFQKQT